MPTTNSTTNSQSKQQGDQETLLKQIVELQDSLLKAQEKNILMLAQVREFDRLARDAEDLKQELVNQNQLLLDKSRENKQLHQELSQASSLLESKLQEIETMKVAITDFQHQLKIAQSERDLLSSMLTEAENTQHNSKGKSKTAPPTENISEAPATTTITTSWLRYLKGKQQ
jgi:hypothetical protein